ncbi:MAG: DNA adenine methylase [Burkholderia gladioli]
MKSVSAERAPKFPLITYFGGKFRIASWVIQHLPPHDVYVEPYGGSAGVLLQKPRSRVEVYNDLDGEIVNLFRVLRDTANRAQLIEQLRLTSDSRAEFERAWQACEEPIERARRMCIRAEMGFGSAGGTRPLHNPVGFAVDIRSHSTGQGQWQGYPDRLAVLGERLADVLVENWRASSVIARYDGPDTLFYVDPPYVPNTRSSASTTGRDYRHEMTDFDHAELLAARRNLRGMAVVSGYASALYDQALTDWKRVTRKVSAQGQKGTVQRDEVLWISPAACRAAGAETSGAVVVEVDAALPLFAALGDEGNAVGG